MNQSPEPSPKRACRPQYRHPDRCQGRCEILLGEIFALAAMSASVIVPSAILAESDRSISQRGGGNGACGQRG